MRIAETAGIAIAAALLAIVADRFILVPPSPVDNASNAITFEAALQSVGRGLREMTDAENQIDSSTASLTSTSTKGAAATKPPDPSAQPTSAPAAFRTGLLPSEVVVTFNISAKGTLTNQVGLSAEHGPIVKGSATATADNSAERGNQIKITFKNIYIEKDLPLWTISNPDDLSKRLMLIGHTMATSSDDFSIPVAVMQIPQKDQHLIIELLKKDEING
jgi:hypothetical protein